MIKIIPRTVSTIPRGLLFYVFRCLPISHYRLPVLQALASTALAPFKLFADLEILGNINFGGFHVTRAT